LEPDPVKAVAVFVFLSGLLLAVRVMFFGVQRRIDEQHLDHRAWPLALAGFLVAVGAMAYARSDHPNGVTASWVIAVVLVGTLAGGGARWVVKRSAAIPSTDPEDDPRYRFQGHVARVTESIVTNESGASRGRIAFEFDGKHHDLRAVWSPEGDLERQTTAAGLVDNEVVIDRVDGDIAYVEPWTVVEERL
jgi:hypothetical protein